MSTACVCAVHYLYLLLMRYSAPFPLLLAGTKIKEFDPSPKGCIHLAPGFWLLLLWESSFFMHNDVHVLEQVTYHTS